MDSLEERIREVAAARGAAALGVADLSAADARELIAAQGGPVLAAFPRAVAFLYRLQDGLVDPLPEHHREVVPARLYDRHVYQGANDRLDAIAHDVASALQEAGFEAVPISASMYIDDEEILGPLPHKLAAHLAGLGWIGRSCLLVTRRRGPRVRLGTVLTDAPLGVGRPGRDFCGDCDRCMAACPAQAFTGRAFDPSDPVDARMDVRACRDYRAGLVEVSGAPTCGVCVAVCPHGRG